MIRYASLLPSVSSIISRSRSERSGRDLSLPPALLHGYPCLSNRRQHYRTTLLHLSIYIFHHYHHHQQHRWHGQAMQVDT